MSIDGRRVAVVTGASRGIGKETAELLRKRDVVAVGISRHLGDTDMSCRCDVRDEAAVQRVFGTIASRFGRIDILINCAGIASREDPLSLGTEAWEAVFRTNVIGTYLCCKHAIRHMLEQRYGRIVNIGSMAGRSYSRTASVAYTCSKYAVIGLTRHLAAAFGERGIRINCVCPSQTKSEMLSSVVGEDELASLAAAAPMGRLAEPEEVARAVCFLSGDEASYINGAVLDVNGGQV